MFDSQSTLVQNLVKYITPTDSAFAADTIKRNLNGLIHYKPSYVKAVDTISKVVETRFYDIENNSRLLSSVMHVRDIINFYVLYVESELSEFDYLCLSFIVSVLIGDVSSGTSLGERLLLQIAVDFYAAFACYSHSFYLKDYGVTILYLCSDLKSSTIYSLPRANKIMRDRVRSFDRDVQAISLIEKRIIVADMNYIAILKSIKEFTILAYKDIEAGISKIALTQSNLSVYADSELFD